MAANGVEVASTYVTVLAKAPGLANSINKALGGIDGSAAGKKIGQQFSANLGKSLKDTVAKNFADATAAALDKTTSATKKLSDAEHGLLKSRAQHGTATAKVSAAEEKLDALRKSGKASSADLQAAEANLGKAQADLAGTGRNVATEQNKVAEAKRNATEASKTYTDALTKESSKGEQALAWMPLANQRIDELSSKWQTASQKITGVGDSLTSNITKPVLVAGGAVGTLVGALGFKRLVGIDTARGQFKGLGMDADAVMKQVDSGVTNTSLSMATGASLAVGILATGAVPLEGLEAQIKRVANVSAAYNVDGEHAAYLLNNVLSKNKVTYGDLSQMVQNQIPIITQLAEHYGVAGGEIEKMAGRGEISIEDLNLVLDKNAGAAAESYAGTWKGVTSNILSNLGKIGAKFLEPTFNTMKEEAAGFLDMLKTDEFSTLATEMGDHLSNVVTKVSEGIRDLVDWWGNLSGGQKKAIGTAVGVAVALGPVLKIVGLLVGGISKAILVTKVIVGLFTGWKAASNGAALGSAALTGATKAQTIAMNMAAGAQKALNFAFKTNPIIGVVSVIAALVAGLVWFFTKTELGQKIWGEFTRFLGEAWANVAAFFQDIWTNVLQPVFVGIGEVLAFVWNSILKPVFEGIAAVATWVFQNILIPAFNVVQIAFAILGGIFKGIWDFILKPMFVALGAIFTWLYQNIVIPIINGIKLYVQAWAAIFTWLWNVVLKPIFDLIGKIFNWIYQTIIIPIVAGIKLQIQAAGAVFSWLWANAVKPAIDAVGKIFTWLFENIIKPVWDGISSTIKTVWEKGIKPVIDTLSKVIKSDPKKAFEAARDAIGTAWKGIQDLAKKPVKFVIETVINGLIGTVNKILPKAMHIPKVPLPKGFAGGGVLPGYMASKRDDVLMPMRSGEGVLVPEVVRALGPSFVHTLNAAGNSGGVSAVRNQFGAIGNGLARGGLVNPLPQGSYSVSQQWGNAGHNGIDLAAASGTKVFAAADGVVGLAGVVPMGGNEVYIQHANGLGTRYSHLSSFATQAGANVKAGNVIGRVGSTGNSTGPHLHYMVHNPGLGAGSYYPNQNPAPYMGIFGKDLGDAGGGFNVLAGLADWAASQMKSAFPDGGMFTDVAAGLAKSAAEKLAKAFNPFAANDVGTTLYDNGGFLPTGISLVENRSGRPEPIFTGDEFDQMLGSGSSGDEINMTFYGVDNPDETARAVTRGLRRSRFQARAYA